MSVPVNKRSHGKLEVCVKAHDLCCYVLKITATKKIFSTEYQESLTDKIIETAINIHTMCWCANNVLVNNADDLKHRQELQEKAAIQCNLLLSLMDIAKTIFHLETKRIIYWGTLTMETRKLIRAWKESDAERYKAKFKGVG